MTNDAVLLVAAAVAIAAILWFWMRGSPLRRAEAQLRSICLGNAAQAERLIEGELARAPGISREEAARRAVARYRRDNR